MVSQKKKLLKELSVEYCDPYEMQIILLFFCSQPSSFYILHLSVMQIPVLCSSREENGPLTEKWHKTLWIRLD